jgi:hypothetical protein
MKNPFRRVAADEKMEAAQKAYMETESRIAARAAKRAALIAQDDVDLAEVSRLDRENATDHANAALHAERIEALKTVRRQQVRAQLEREKSAGIAEVRKRLAKRHEAAGRLDTALKSVIEAYNELLAADEQAFDMPSTVSPLGGLGHFRLDGIEPLSSVRRPRPPMAGIVRQIVDHYPPLRFAQIVEDKNREVLEMLESAPVADSMEAA